MTAYTTLLRLALQATGENDSTWGDVANSAVFQLLEDAVAGMVSISLTAGNVTLSASNGANDQARYAILNLTGTLAAARDAIVPAKTKLYLVINSTAGSQVVTVKVSGQPGIVVPAGKATWLYCDATDIKTIYASATNADTATLAANSTLLGGIAAAVFARLDQAQTFVGAQRVTRSTLTQSGGNVAVNAALSNYFYLAMAGNWTLQNPTGGVDGQVIRIVIKQDATGSRVITWGSAFAFAAATPAVLSTAANAIDYASFEYDSTSAKWLGGVLKGMG